MKMMKKRMMMMMMTTPTVMQTRTTENRKTMTTLTPSTKKDFNVHDLDTCSGDQTSAAVVTGDGESSATSLVYPIHVSTLAIATSRQSRT